MRAEAACVMVGLGLFVLRATAGRRRRAGPAHPAHRAGQIPAADRGARRGRQHGASPACWRAASVTPHFNFLHRGEIPAGSGIGHHFHNTAEEMFVILGGEAQFTVDGRTSVVKGPAAVLCKLGHSHAIYNHSTQPLQWMNWQVGATPNVSDAFDLGDARVGVPLDPIPVFMTARLDRALARPAAGHAGRDDAPPLPAAGVHHAVDLRRSRAGRAGHDDAGQAARRDRRGLLRDRRQRPRHGRRRDRADRARRCDPGPPRRDQRARQRRHRAARAARHRRRQGPRGQDRVHPGQRARAAP